MAWIRGWAAGMALAILVVAVGPGVHDEDVRLLARSAASAVLPAGGTWLRYRDSSAAVVAGELRPTLMPLVRPIPRPCRPGTTNYGEPNRRFNCLAYYADNGNTGHPVLLRQGAAGEFGYLHALVDHGLDEESIATVIVNNAAGRLQSNGRFQYGMRYEVAGVGIVAVEVYEERQPATAFDDGDGLGVVTAFCVGFSGPCPAGINESLP